MLGKRLRDRVCAATLAVPFGICAWGQSPPPAGRVIDILADHDSRYKMPGQKQPIITVKAGEPITLRITAKKAKTSIATARFTASPCFARKIGVPLMGGISC